MMTEREPLTSAARFRETTEDTPTPWRVSGRGDWLVFDATGQSLIDEDGTTSDVAVAVVEAVNQHEALLGLAQYAKHLHNCAKTRTSGGLQAPGKCDCGLDDWLAKLEAANHA